MIRTQNIDLENTLIVRITTNKADLAEAAQKLEANDLLDVGNRQIFEAALTTFKKGEDFAIFSLDKKLSNKIMGLHSTDPGIGGIESVISGLRECSYRRNVQQIAKRVVEGATTGEIENVKKDIGKFFVINSENKPDLMNVHDQNEYYLNLIEKRKDPASGEAGCPYPFKLLQSATLGAQRGEMILIAARPSIGKSAMLENIAHYQANQGFRALFFSAEMSKDAILDRQIARLMNSDVRDLRQGNVDYGDLTPVLDVRKNFYLLDMGSMTTLDIRSQLYKAKLTHGVDVVFVDYLQKLLGEGKTEYERVSRISRELKAIAVDFNLPVIVACQYNRSADGGRPQLSDIRDSGNIEQDADVVISLWREKEPKKSENDEYIETYLDILKNRNGATIYDYVLRFSGKRTEFTE